MPLAIGIHIAGAQTQLVWGDRSLVASDAGLVWDDLELVGASLDVVWDIAEGVGRAIELLWRDTPYQLQIIRDAVQTVVSGQRVGAGAVLVDGSRVERRGDALVLLGPSGELRRHILVVSNEGLGERRAHTMTLT